MLLIVLGCLSAVCFGYAAIAFRERGPLFSARLTGNAENTRAAVRAEYRAIATAFAGLGLCFFSFACFFLLGFVWLACLSVALSAAVTGYACAFCSRIFRPQRHRA